MRVLCKEGKSAMKHEDEREEEEERGGGLVWKNKEET